MGNEGQRLGKNGADEIKNHEFFRGIDFNCDLRKKEAPHKPKIKFAEDTSNFDPIDEGKLRPDEEHINEEDSNSSYHGFYEFTFRRFFDDAGQPVFMPGPNAKRSMVMRTRVVQFMFEPTVIHFVAKHCPSKQARKNK